MIVAVIGSRNFNNYDLLEKILDKEQISSLVSGGARGADSLAVRYARRRGILFREFLANWNDISHPDALVRYHPDGKPYDARAGMRRNMDIVQAADKVIAFWDARVENSGTFDAMQKAKALNKKLTIVKYLDYDDESSAGHSKMD